MEVIEYLDNKGDVLVGRYPLNGECEITWGSQLTVRENQEAVFYRDGKSLDVFSSGRHVLQTQNIPKISKWVTRFGYGESSPFRSEVYFVSKKLFPNLKWGTSNSILFRDEELKSVRLRSFGILSISIEDSMVFVNKVVGNQGLYKIDQIKDYLKNVVISKLTDVLSKEIKSVFDLSRNYELISIKTKLLLDPFFKGLGIKLEDFIVNSISLPEEVQKIIDDKSSMNVVGNLDKFMKYKLASSIDDALRNENGLTGSMVGAGAGLGLGFSVPNIIQGSMKSEGGNDPLEQIKKLTELLDIGAINDQEYKTKKDELLNDI